MSNSSILILGDEKDHASKIQGKHYADGNGRLFWHLLYEAGVNVRDIDFKYCTAQTIDPRPYRIVVSLGQRALDSVYNGDVRRFRGSVITLGSGGETTLLIPTLHPRDLKKPFEVFKESQVETAQLVLLDLKKVVRIYEKGFERVDEQFTLSPTIADLEAFVDESKEYPYLGVDIEATGLNIDYANMVTIGFACSSSRAFVCPLRTSGGKSYWQVSELDRVNRALNELLLNRTLIFQNGYGYDVPLLRRNGYEIPWDNFLADTMLLHHTLDPELPHNIGFISSIWGTQPYWKESFLERKEHIYDTDQIEMRRYNARDCTALIEIYEAMWQEIEERNLTGVAERAMAQVPAIVTMKERGIGYDEKKAKYWQGWINREVQEKEGEVRERFSLPDAFNFNSQDHMNWFLFGHMTDGVKASLKDREEYDKPQQDVQYACVRCGKKRTLKFNETFPATLEAKCTTCSQTMPHERTEKPPKESKAKRRDTAIFKKLDGIRQILECDPLTQPLAFRPTRTGNGKLGTGRENIAKFLNATRKRQETLDGQKRPDLQEKQGLQATADFLGTFQELTKLLKVRSSFYDMPRGADGRIHPTLLIQGTATARYACIEPNGQQMPNSKSVAGGKVRDMFSALSPMYTLLSCDYSNLEVNTGSRFMDDKVLISQLEQGLDLHDENTKTFFGVDKNHPDWAQLRAASKIIQFGRLFYGGSDRGIYNKVRVAVPNVDLTLEDFQQAVQRYFEAHPDFADFVDAVQRKALVDRVSVNGFGRERNLYGPAAKLKRQALNSPIQGTAADFLINVIIRLWNRGLGNKFKSYMALQIHDELLYMLYLPEEKEMFSIIYEEMLRPQTILNYKGEPVTFSVPINAEIGKNWGSQDQVDLLTGKIMGGTAH